MARADKRLYRPGDETAFAEAQTDRLIAAAAHPSTAQTSTPQPTSFRMVCSEPERESDKVDQLYQAFQQAMQQTGGSVKQSRENFSEFVSKKTKELQKQKNCREVEYVVEVVNGEVKLKALVKT